MQFNNKDYNPDQHDRWRALTVKNPYATQLVTAAFEDGGFVYAEKSIEVRSKYTNYRGDLLICSSKNPVGLGANTDTPGETQSNNKGVRLVDAEPPPGYRISG